MRFFIIFLLNFFQELFTGASVHMCLAPPLTPPGMRRHVRVRDRPANEEPYNPSVATAV